MAPIDHEERYFKELEERRLAERRHQQAIAAQDQERQSHYMRCPKCGGQLEVIQHENIEVDRCKDCSGIWLDAGELEYLTSTTKSSTFFGFLTRRKS